MNQFIKTANQFINGEWKEGSSNNKGTIFNPFNNEVITDVALATKEDVNNAFLIAEKAQKEWAKTSAEEKIAILNKAAKYMEDHSEEIVDIMVQESGSTVGKAQFELYATLQAFKDASTYPNRMETVVTPSKEAPGKVNHVIRKPIGVVSSAQSVLLTFHCSYPLEPLFRLLLQGMLLFTNQIYKQLFPVAA